MSIGTVVVCDDTKNAAVDIGTKATKKLDQRLGDVQLHCKDGFLQLTTTSNCGKVHVEIILVNMFYF